LIHALPPSISDGEQLGWGAALSCVAFCVVVEEEQPVSKRDAATASAVVAVIVALAMLSSTPLGSERYKRALHCAGGKKGSGVEFRYGMDYYSASYCGDLLLRQRWV
jgi:hypothetical protein